MGSCFVFGASFFSPSAAASSAASSAGAASAAASAAALSAPSASAAAGASAASAAAGASAAPSAAAGASASPPVAAASPPSSGGVASAAGSAAALSSADVVAAASSESASGASPVSGPYISRHSSGSIDDVYTTTLGFTCPPLFALSSRSRKSWRSSPPRASKARGHAPRPSQTFFLIHASSLALGIAAQLRRAAAAARSTAAQS